MRLQIRMSTSLSSAAIILVASLAAIESNQAATHSGNVNISLSKTTNETSDSLETNSATTRLAQFGSNTTGALLSRLNKPGPTLDKSTQSRRSNFGNQAQGSLLRPSFLRGFFAKPKQAAGKQTEVPDEQDDEQEVTKTIYVPIGSSLDSSLRPKSLGRPGVASGGLAGPLSAQQIDGQPNAEASLRLTSTEMSGLLSDRDAPEFYRARELNGAGVLVGEEPPQRLSTGASGDPFSGSSGRFGEPAFAAGSFDVAGDEAALYRHRLAQAESAAFGPAGFEHRFGKQAGAFNAASGDDELAAGRLMQLPNDYSELGGLHHQQQQQQQQQRMAGSQLGAGGYPQQQAHLGDLQSFAGPHSGLLRASSSAFGGDSRGYESSLGELADGQAMGASGAMLNELAHQQRLQAHEASFNAYQDDYASRFGAAMGGLGEQRGFASAPSGQQVLAGPRGQAGARRLLPLSPTVPMPDERALHSGVSARQRAAPIVHEPLEDEPSELAQADEQEESNTDFGEPSTMSSNGNLSGGFGPSTNGPSVVLNVPPPGNSIGSSSACSPNGATSSDEEPSTCFDDEFVEPNRRPAFGSAKQQTERIPSSEAIQLVEFARIGSAGYLAPHMQHKAARILRRKSMLGKDALAIQTNSIGKHKATQSGDGDYYDQGRAQSSFGGGAQMLGPGGQVASGLMFEPADNPAHAGKYIIT